MPLYECVFIARNDITQQQVEAIAEQVAGLVTEGGGEVKKREYWGLRGLAFKIKKNRKGHYMLLGIDAPGTALPEVERQLGLNEDVLRSLMIKVEAIDDAPSAVLAKRGEDRDRERGFRDLLAAECPGVKVVADQFAMGDRAKARAAAENMLAAHPGLNGFFASTEPASAGIALALKARGAAGKVRFVGFDFSDTMTDDLRAGVLDAMVIQNPYQLGFEAVRTLHEKLSGRMPEKRIDLPARVVTAASLDDSEVRRILNPEAGK
mgnify:CR=1 FL=1